MNNKNIRKVSEIVGKGYNRYWNFKGRYLVVKGGRGSKKSTTTSLRFIKNIMKYPQANLLVVRQFYNTHKDSTYSQLSWATEQLGVRHLFEFKKVPLEIVYIPTGQKIIFRGLDKPQSITSITVDVGVLCWVWWEEAFQVVSEDDFNKVDMSIRGSVPEGHFKQHVITFNPWSEHHWLKKRFFDKEDEDVFAITTNYQCNEFLDKDDLRIFEKMRLNEPRRYQVEGLGNWGIAEGLVYERWTVQEFNVDELRKTHKAYFGLDFGYVADATAFVCVMHDDVNKKIYIFDEHYERGMLNDEIARMIQRKGYSKERVIADSSEPKSIEEIRRLGIDRIKPARKGKDSVMNGIGFVQQHEIIVHPSCENTIVELTNYTWATDRTTGKTLNRPVDEFNHILDALRYALEQAQKPSEVKAVATLY